jgi:hypothetical protein
MRSAIENTVTVKPAPESKHRNDLAIAIIGVVSMISPQAGYEQARTIAAALCGQASTARAAPVCAAE